MNFISVPGKILLFGSYAILEKENIGLSIAVLDMKNNGVIAKFKPSSPRIISRQFNIDLKPVDFSSIVSCAYLFAQNYLQSKNLFKNDICVELFNSPIFGPKDQKSGLGSSAAATVAIIKSLFLAQGLDLNKNLDVIHKIAQYSYSFFSKKVGSGYDIATCCYETSILYKRFDPLSIKISDNFDLNLFLKSINKNWKNLLIKPFKFPKNYKIIFFNILNNSTSTIENVKILNEFKNSSDINKKFCLNQLKKQNKAELLAIKSILKKDDKTIRHYTHIARRELNLLSDKLKAFNSKFVDIEPTALAKVIFDSENLDGVVFGRCPGAGGYDSLAFVVNKDFDNENKILQIAKNYKVKLKKIPLKLL